MSSRGTPAPVSFSTSCPASATLSLVVSADPCPDWQSAITLALSATTSGRIPSIREGSRVMDRERQVCNLLDGLHDPFQFVCLLADEGAGVDVDVMRPCLGLCHRLTLDKGTIPGANGLGNLFSRCIDSFRNDQHKFVPS